jgi:chain length determinant protein EpsF
MDINQFMLALRARRKAFLMVFAAVVVTAVAVAVVLPKKYVATATLLIDARDEQTMAPIRMTGRERMGYIATQIDLIKSPRVAKQVARDLKLAHKPGVREAWESATGGAGTLEDWLAAGLAEGVLPEVPSSNVMSITYASRDPREAAEIANAFAKAYLDTALALRTEPTRDAAAWFDKQLQSMRAQVNQAQARLAAYQKSKGITFFDERADVDATRLGELMTAYAAARNTSHEAQIRYRQAQDVAQSGTPDAMAEIMASGPIGEVRATLARAEAAFAAAAVDLGPNHPVYQRLEADLKAQRARLDSEMKKVVASLGNAAQQAQRREEELKRAVAEQTARVQSMKDHRAVMLVMARDVENAQRAYDTVLTRYNANKIDSRATSTNVAMLSSAIEPLKPAQPKVGLISALAVVLGALLAAAVVYVLEYLDRRVRSRTDLEARLAVPSIGRLSRWQPSGGRLLPAPARATRALPHPW